MRYLPLTASDRQSMLTRIGVDNIENLFKDVPSAAHLTKAIENIPAHKSEMEVERILAALAKKNISAGECPSFLGAGAYRHHVPALVDQMILRGEFLTSYTPYQPEVSQGTLQYLFEFQTQVSMLVGMDCANASMYDGASAAAEAVLMATRITGRKNAVLSGNLHPHYRDVIKTSVSAGGFGMEVFPPNLMQDENLIPHISNQTSCVVVQNPDFFGRVHDFTKLAEHCHAVGALLIVAVTEIVSLGLLPPPGDMGADIVVGEGQGLGNGLNFGGPYLGLFACKEKYVRQMPGRLCGQTVDAEGRRGFVLTLSAREQHIRREKATSNICTNSGLCALAFTIHLSLLGEDGLKQLANLNHAKACKLVDALEKIQGVEIINQTFFNEIVIRLPKSASMIVDTLVKKPILAGVPLSRFYGRDMDNYLLLAVTEMTVDADIDALCNSLLWVLA